MSEATTESTTSRISKIEASNVFSSMDLSAVCDASTVLAHVAGTKMAEKRRLWQDRNLRAPAMPRYPKPEHQQGNATHGVKHLVKDFAKIIHKRAGKVVFVNLTEPARDWDAGTLLWLDFKGSDRLNWRRNAVRKDTTMRFDEERNSDEESDGEQSNIDEDCDVQQKHEDMA
ncbi:NAD-dependent histone deacetylase HST3 [Dichotomopilus funicola]|uniref:NAD-dependent histone deacetylase HST3 n=1 Tax=Dichotomopilus funicola TaxID=1934379 RepID=A0AAN6UTZ6_9PEZI|nr:NAD-dependent histone deacetylase HST3 [Dichotomopilus funicola]